MTKGNIKYPVRGRVMNGVLLTFTQKYGISSTTSSFIIKEKNPNTTLSISLESSFPKIFEITCKTRLISTAKIPRENILPSRENCLDLGATNEVT